jgi:diaminohydroxyphosphoribosylaminopyrimidine deaminase/5-amino-6-(5-phosphoribosylamino)uracil reductase
LKEAATFSRDDELYMRRALRLAERGRGTTRPNPVVGAVLARGGQVLAEAFHRRAGEAHAEVRALQAVGGRADGATLYVNLEPCCHVGRTGPCTDAIIAAGVRRVVVGCRDRNPKVDGRGIRRLRRAGIAVEVGCREDDSREANRAFFVWVSLGRPLVTLKAAATLDGYIAQISSRKGQGPIWITGESARRAAHQLRAAHDAILVGAGTVLTDDPRLTVRIEGGSGRRAEGGLRVVLDGRLRTPPAARVLRGSGAGTGRGRVAGGGPALVIGARGAPTGRAGALEKAGAEVLLLPARRGRIAIAAVLTALAERGIQSVLVEGGAEVHGGFIRERLVDRVALFVAPRLIGGGVPVAAGAGWAIAQALELGPLQARSLDGDLLLTADAVDRW